MLRYYIKWLVLMFVVTISLIPIGNWLDSQNRAKDNKHVVTSKAERQKVSVDYKGGRQASRDVLGLAIATAGANNLKRGKHHYYVHPNGDTERATYSQGKWVRNKSPYEFEPIDLAVSSAGFKVGQRTLVVIEVF